MKLMHLSDLHIGKRVNEFSMIDDQKFILAQILALAEKECPEGVIIAGDVYDKPIPGVEAVRLFDHFLTEIAGLQIPVFMISGNHDSVERLSFGARLMEKRNVHISEVYDGTIKKVRLQDAYGPVDIWLLPFLKPAAVRHGLEAAGEAEIPEISSCQDAVKTALERIHPDREVRNVLVAHQFVTGAERCESEEIIAGGLDQVDASLFEDFDYVALGHLHSPQKVIRETIRYCGTPLKYSFSECRQQKSVTMVELGEKGTKEIRTVPLKPLHYMRVIRGTYMEVTAKSFYEGTNQSDYLKIILTDEEDIPDGLQKLRIIYPNLMRLEYDNCRTRENRKVEGNAAVEQRSELELFEEFFAVQNNQEMTREQRKFAETLIGEIREKSAGKDRE